MTTGFRSELTNYATWFGVLTHRKPARLADRNLVPNQEREYRKIEIFLLQAEEIKGGIKVSREMSETEFRTEFQSVCCASAPRIRIVKSVFVLRKDSHLFLIAPSAK